LRGGVLYNSEFGKRMRGEGPFAEQIRTLFEVARRRVGLDRPSLKLATDRFVRPTPSREEREHDEQLYFL
jgi:hypothetical protein